MHRACKAARGRIPVKDLRTAQTMSAFFIVPTTTKRGVGGELFATHPTLGAPLGALGSDGTRYERSCSLARLECGTASEGRQSTGRISR